MTTPTQAQIEVLEVVMKALQPLADLADRYESTPGAAMSMAELERCRAAREALRDLTAAMQQKDET